MFYRVVFDSSIKNYTHFREPTTAEGKCVDAWSFLGEGVWKGKEQLFIGAQNLGAVYDMNMGAFDLPIAGTKVKHIFEQDQHFSLEVQFIPVSYNSAIYFILNPLLVVDCLDEQRSKVLKWIEKDGRPEKVGEYRQVINLHVDPERLGGVDICRIKGWVVAIIFSERLVKILKKEEIKGVKFEKVV